MLRAAKHHRTISKSSASIEKHNNGVLPTCNRDKSSCSASKSYRALRRHVNDDERILRVFEENPQNSIGRVSRALGIPQTIDTSCFAKKWVALFPFSTCATTFSTGWSTVHLFLWRYFYFFISIFFYIYSAKSAINIIIINKTCVGFLAQCRRNASFPDHILWTGIEQRRASSLQRAAGSQRLINWTGLYFERMERFSWHALISTISKINILILLRISEYLNGMGLLC